MNSSSDLLSMRARVLRVVEGSAAGSVERADDARVTGPSAPNVYAFADVRPATPATRAAAASAYREGFDAGLAEGFGQCEEQAVSFVESRRDAHERLLLRIDAAMTAHRNWVVEEDERSARLLADAAIQLAEAVIGQVLGRPAVGNGLTAADVVAGALRRVAGQGGPAAMVTARMHPDDAALIDPSLFNCALAVVGDSSLERGDCIANIGDRRIDARIGAALARARASVLGEESASAPANAPVEGRTA